MSLPEFFQNMDRRKRLALGGGVALILFIFGFLVPMADQAKELEKKLTATRQELAEMRSLSAEYRRYASNSPGLVTGGALNLSSTVNLAIDSSGLRQRISKMSARYEGRPEEEIYIEANKTSLPELVNFLKAVDGNGTGLEVKRATVKPGYEDRNNLDVTVSIGKKQ